MARTQETWVSWTGSPYVNVAMQQIFWLLWGYVDQGLTKGEIDKALRDQNVPNNPTMPWEKQIPLMVKLGIMKKGNKRHCSVRNKEDATWLLTDLAVPAKPRANKPSAKKFVAAVAQFEAMLAQHESRGDGMVSPELRQLYAWVRDKVPEK